MDLMMAMIDPCKAIYMLPYIVIHRISKSQPDLATRLVEATCKGNLYSVGYLLRLL